MDQVRAGAVSDDAEAIERPSLDSAASQKHRGDAAIGRSKAEKSFGFSVSYYSWLK
jgi:hypothetical protein